MSAREPFFPKRSEKVSEAAKPVQNQNQNPTEPPVQPSTDTRSNPSINDNHRPLNVSGLIKSKSSKKKESDPNPTLKPRGSFEHIRRPIPPAKPKPILETIAQNKRQTSQANLSASASTFSASVSDLAPSNAPPKPPPFFKPISTGAVAESSPAVGSARIQGNISSLPVQSSSDPSQTQLTSDRNNNNAHTRPQVFGSPDPFHFKPSDDQSPFAPEMTSGFGSGFRISAAAANDDDSSAPMLAMIHKATTDKRARADDDDGDEEEDNEHVRGGSKRRKESEMQDVEASPTFSPNVPTQHNHYYREHEPPAAMMLYDNGPSSGPIREHQAHPHADDALPTYSHNHNQPSSRASTVVREFSEVPEPAAVQESEVSILEDILGVDVNAFVFGKLDQYEANKKKWAECAADKWSAGGQELVEHFNGLIDFVKDHMAAKMKLFQSFDDKIAAHKAVLKSRTEVLDEAKAGLIANGRALA